jgi:3-methyladenine DNA glycosylase Mpg
MSVPEFCDRNKIGESSYFYLRAIGRAPKSTRIGRRIIIFPQDEAAWRLSIQENPLPSSLRRAAEAAAEKEAA